MAVAHRLTNEAQRFATANVFPLHWPALSPPCKASQQTHLHSFFTTSAQRLRRWSDIVQMLYKCFVFADWLDFNCCCLGIHVSVGGDCTGFEILPRLCINYTGIRSSYSNRIKYKNSLSLNKLGVVYFRSDTVPNCIFFTFINYIIFRAPCKS